MAHLDAVLACGQAFGCEILCGPTPLGHRRLHRRRSDRATEFKAGVDTLRKGADKAKERGIRLAVEYLNRFENYFLTTAAQAARSSSAPSTIRGSG